MLEFSDVAVAHAIELAVAPVFLLTAIGAILAVMTKAIQGKGNLDVFKELFANNFIDHRLRYC